MTTLKTLTYSKIRALRSEASEAGDMAQVWICDIALDEEADPTDYNVSLRDRRWIRKMDRDEALKEIVRVIRDAEGQQ